VSPVELIRPAAADLERALGDPLDDQRPGSFARTVAADTAEAYPHELWRAVYDWGFVEHLLPAEVSGKLTSLEECFALSRVLSRRDLTVAVSYGAGVLAGLPVWLRGTQTQKEEVARLLRGGGSLAFALSEREHGADIAASEVVARETSDGGWRIGGTKWLINNARLAAGMTITARTGTGIRGLTVFFVSHELVDSPRWRRLPKISTHGVRGSAFGGFEFRDLPAAGEAVVGRRGEGMTILLKTLQVSRVLVASFALGGLDTCLRAAVAFARGRQLYGVPISRLGAVARRLADAYADLLIGETVALAACRAVHLCPGQLPLMSACVKYLVPQLCNDSIESLGVVLGARSYLAEEHWSGIFDKMRRDCAVTSLFDGSTPVNLDSIVGQLPLVVQARRAGRVRPLPPRLFAAHPGDLPWLDEAAFDLASDDDAVHDGVRLARETLGAEAGPVTYRAELLEALDTLGAASLRCDAEVVECSREADWRRSGAAYDLAARYSHLHAAGACALAWLQRRHESTDEFITSGAWLVFRLWRLASRIGSEPVPLDDLDRSALARLDAAVNRGLLISDIDVQATSTDTGVV
jgi:alkylation response protein AidB-like acyl-CoA dehydrogenase